MKRALLAAFFLCFVGGAGAQDPFPNCRGFIQHACCCTNSCCWEISASEVEPLPGDMWRIRSTGQELRRTDFSPDGKYYRCACDYDINTGKWNKHQGAKTRCLYVPPSLF